MNKNNKNKYLMLIVFIFAVIIPMVNLLSYIRLDEAKALFSSDQFGALVFNSIVTTVIATIISVSFAFIVSWLLNRSNVKFKSIYASIFTMPMLIPSISHAIGLIILLGSNGILTKLLNIDISLFGFNGIILGSILYSFPVAFLLLNDAFRYEDYTTYEAAEILGLSPMSQFLKITIPNINKNLIAAIFSVFTMIFTDYGVPLMIGGKFQTLSTYMYREIIGLLNFSNGAIIGALLLIPALIAFIIDVKTKENNGNASVKKDFVIKENKNRDLFANIFIPILCLFLLLPIGSFVVLSFVKHFPQDMSFSLDHMKTALDLGLKDYLINSLVISLSTALLGTIVSYISAYLTAKSEKNFSTMMLHLLSIFSLAIPGVVLGLGYVLLFSGSIIYNTVFILIMVNIVHFFSSPYLLAYNTFKTLSDDYEDISAIYGISKWKMINDVYVPNMEKTIYEMFSYFFINAMITISAVSFLSNVKNQPLALLIPQLDSQSLIEPTALISLIILLINLLFKLVMYFVKGKEVNYE